MKTKTFFTDFMNAYAKSDKKTYRETLGPFFASPDSCIDFVNESFAKFEERSPEKWNELIKASYNDGKI